MKIIGVMSGTSLDGVDLVAVEFFHENDKIAFRLLASETVSYDLKWKKILQEAVLLSGEKLCSLDQAYGHFLGSLVSQFLHKYSLHADLVSSHGHTIFHQPQNGFTTQIGNGSAICSETGITVVNDFRTLDVALGGQGAPLVPIGDQLLFNDYTYCLNLGGIANISYNNAVGHRIAFDICPVNMMLNRLAEEKQLAFDKDGELAANGNVNQELLSTLNQLDYYQHSPPKSLGYEWFLQNFLPKVSSFSISVEDKLSTVCHHVAQQVSLALQMQQPNQSILVTGGGAKNKFLVALLNRYCSIKVAIPETQLIDFKEAIVFALLGYLRLQNIPNVLCSVTGAKRDSVSGVLHGNFSSFTER